MKPEGKISPADLDLLLLADTPEDVVAIIQDNKLSRLRSEQEEQAREVTRQALGK
jgi:hypothetical protein